MNPPFLLVNIQPTLAARFSDEDSLWKPGLFLAHRREVFLGGSLMGNNTLNPDSIAKSRPA